MEQETAYSGSCLCGAVQFTAEIAAQEMAVCHCAMCRKWSGGNFFAVEPQAITFAQDDQLGVFSSSEWGERCFCKSCGTSLLWRAKDGSYLALAAQSLDRADEFPLKTQIFIDEKPATYDFAQETHNMTGAQVFAAFAPPAQS